MCIQLAVRYPQIVNTAPAFSFHLFPCSLASSSNLVISPISLPVSGSEEEEEEMRISTKSLFRSCHNHPIYWKCYPRATGWQLEEKENEGEKRWQGIEWRSNGYGHSTLHLVWLKEKWECVHDRGPPHPHWSVLSPRRKGETNSFHRPLR